jgi:hypothetical protein
MTPTSRLRFVERGVPAPEHGENVYKTVRILQQWWDDDSWKHVNRFDADGKPISTGKWIDIPLEKE